MYSTAPWQCAFCKRPALNIHSYSTSLRHCNRHLTCYVPSIAYENSYYTSTVRRLQHVVLQLYTALIAAGGGRPRGTWAVVRGKAMAFCNTSQLILICKEYHSMPVAKAILYTTYINDPNSGRNAEYFDWF